MCTVNNEVVQFAPIHLLEKLLDEPIFARASPDHGIVLVVEEEPDGHDCQVVDVDWRPTFSTLVHFLAYQSQDSRHTRSTNVNIKQSHFMLFGQEHCQLGGDSALTHSSLPRQDQDDVFD